MSRFFWLALLIAAPAAAENWTRIAVTDEVAISVHVLSTHDLAVMVRASNPADVRNVRRDHEHGHAVLRRHAKTGAWRCDIYVKADATEATLEHERRHCHGWAHP